MTTQADLALAGAIRHLARPLSDRDPHDALLDAIGDARLVLIGEASHGTREFYAERARITQRLVAEKGFHAVAVEADWPDAYRVNRYVRGFGGDPDADAALSGFERFPTWMWRNAEVLSFVEWLRAHDDALPPEAPRAGFYGLDLYSLHGSIAEVLRYLDGIDPEAARVARSRYACFDRIPDDAAGYGLAASRGILESCEDAVVAQLVSILERAERDVPRDGAEAEEAWFEAAQNARVVQSAEAYYRTMYRGGIASWNLRDRHMADTLDQLLAHLDRRVGRSKVVVWEHNSHVGDARATELGARGELNVGQLARERHGDDVYIVGFTTHSGTVTAASEWGGAAELKRVRPALPGSYEALFHDVGLPRFALDLRALGEASDALVVPRLERAIGVLYLPATERQSHYFEATLPPQFDTIIHLDRTTAVEPLEREPRWEPGEPPETYPSAL